MTPPALAKRWGVGADKVLAFIKSGELRAVNLATKQRGRPRWHIPDEAIEAFELRRAAHATTQPAPRAQRRRNIETVTQYF